MPVPMRSKYYYVVMIRPEEQDACTCPERMLVLEPNGGEGKEDLYLHGAHRRKNDTKRKGQLCYNYFTTEQERTKGVS